MLQLMLNRRIRSMPVIEDDQRLAEVVSRQDVMSALEKCARSDP